MNPNTPQTSFELPTPQTSGNEQNRVKGESMPSQPEVASQAPMQGMPAFPQAPSLPQQPLAQQPIDPMAPHAQSTTSIPMPTTADDNDLIEKEWVEKAKQIVAATREDPYAQTKEISRFKADYLKKRYNKDI